MIKLEVIDTPPNNKNHITKHHFLVRSNEPMRIEVSVDRGGTVIAHVYKGYKVDMEQSPVGAYDSTIGPNEGWVKR